MVCETMRIAAYQVQLAASVWHFIRIREKARQSMAFTLDGSDLTGTPEWTDRGVREAFP